jgi:hypothetical protein
MVCVPSSSNSQPIPDRILTDITYGSLAKAFNQSLVHHPETLRRLEAMTRHRPWSSQQTSQQTSQQLEATRRMALFPDQAEVIFVGSDLWVVRYFYPSLDVITNAPINQACSAAGRETMHLSGHCFPVSENVDSTYAVSPSPAPPRTTDTHTNIHRVSSTHSDALTLIPTRLVQTPRVYDRTLPHLASISPKTSRRANRLISPSGKGRLR